VGVAIGVDSHKHSLAAAAVDELGRVLGSGVFPNDPSGHRALLRWMKARGEPRRIGVECSGTFGAGLTRYLLASGEEVNEVPGSLTHRERRRRSSHGKIEALPHDPDKQTLSCAGHHLSVVRSLHHEANRRLRSGVARAERHVPVLDGGARGCLPRIVMPPQI
jgi:hypothetical protein